MTVSINTAPISPLRQRMQNDMIMRGLGSHTQKDYIRHVKRLAAFLGRPPDSATEDVLRRFQLMQHSPDLKVADIFRAAGPAYRVAHAGHLSLHQLKVMSAIETSAPLLWAIMSKPARTAGTGGSRLTAAETGIAPNARAPPRAPGWPNGRRTYSPSMFNRTSRVKP